MYKMFGFSLMVLGIAMAVFGLTNSVPSSEAQIDDIIENQRQDCIKGYDNISTEDCLRNTEEVNQLIKSYLPDQ